MISRHLFVMFRQVPALRHLSKCVTMSKDLGFERETDIKKKSIEREVYGTI